MTQESIGNIIRYGEEQYVVRSSKRFINKLAYQYQVSSEVEQWIDNPLVSGSIPLPGTILKHISLPKGL